MSRVGRASLWMALLVGVPTLANWLYSGTYVVDPANHRTFWIGPIGTTLPFVVLALLFVAHCVRSSHGKPSAGSVSPSALGGVALAWSAMMAFTLFLISHPAGPRISSTMGIAVLMTPVFYFAVLAIAYPFGALVGKLLSLRTPSKGAAN